MTNGRDHSIKVKLHRRLLSDGPLTLGELCEQVILYSGPSAYPLPDTYGRPLLKALQGLGLVDVIKGRPQKFTASWGGKPSLPEGYLYDHYRGSNELETGTDYVTCPQWGNHGQVHVFLKDGNAEGAVYFFRQQGRELEAKTRAEGLGLGAMLLPAGFDSTGVRVTAPLERIELLAEFLQKLSYG